MRWLMRTTETPCAQPPDQAEHLATWRTEITRVSSSIDELRAVSLVRAMATVGADRRHFFDSRAARFRLELLNSASAAQHGALVEDAERPDALLSCGPKHVLRGRQVIGQGEVLIDHLDARRASPGLWKWQISPSTVISPSVGGSCRDDLTMVDAAPLPAPSRRPARSDGSSAPSARG
jgi:hypothetical protein